MRSFRRLVSLYLWLIAIAAVPAWAQLTAVTGASISMAGTPITQGVAVFVPVNSGGSPTPYTIGGGGINVPIGGFGQYLGKRCTIVNGAIVTDCHVADASQTLPSGLLYNIIVTDTSTGNPTSGKSYTLQRVAGISGASWALDTYSQLTAVSNAPQFTYTEGTGAPTGGCASPSLYGDVSSAAVALYACKLGVWIPATGSVSVTQTGGGGGTVVTLQTITSALGGAPVLAAMGNAAQTLPTSDYITTSRPQYAGILAGLHGIANGGVARIRIVGDSRSIVDTTVTPGAANTLSVTFANRWVEKLRKYLQGVYGSHGTGFQPIFWGQGVGTLPNLDYYSTSATLGNDCSIGPSVSQSQYCSTASLPAGQSLTFTTAIPYDHIRVKCDSYSGAGTLSVAIDGNAAGTVCTGSTSNHAALVGASSAVPLATHTAVLSCASGGQACLFEAVEGEAGTSGVSIDNDSVGGAALGAFASNPATQFAYSDATPEGTQLVIELHHTNEPGIGESTTQFQTELNNLITHERALASNPSIELVALAQDQLPNASPTIQVPFYNIIASTALAQNTGFVDVRNRTGAAFQPFWFGPDGIHENNAGNDNNFAMISAPWLDSPTPAGGAGAAATPFTGGVITTPLTATSSSGAGMGYGFNVSGADPDSFACWGTGQQGGLTGSCGFFDPTLGTFVWVTNTAGDFCLDVPFSQAAVNAGTANVAGCASAGLNYKRSTKTLYVNNLVVLGTQTGGGGGGGVSYGTPTISSPVSAAFPTGWANDDHTMTIILPSTPAYAASTTIATVTFGKQPADASGNAVNPSCSVNGVAGGALYPAYIYSVSNTQVGLKLLPSTTIPAGTADLIYSLQCGFTTEK